MVNTVKRTKLLVVLKKIIRLWKLQKTYQNDHRFLQIGQNRLLSLVDISLEFDFLCLDKTTSPFLSKFLDLPLSFSLPLMDHPIFSLSFTLLSPPDGI